MSSDTSIFPGFGIEQTLAVLMANRLVAAGGVQRVAIVGPGLDFADQRQGYDFYPVQTIQPFAAIDSLIKLGLSSPGQIRVTTFDVSPRINDHLEGARQRAEVGIFKRYPETAAVLRQMMKERGLPVPEPVSP